jgi:hypothetical protein
LGQKAGHGLSSAGQAHPRRGLAQRGSPASLTKELMGNYQDPQLAGDEKGRLCSHFPLSQGRGASSLSPGGDTLFAPLAGLG